MDPKLTKVSLTGPAKVDGHWKRPGDSVEVDHEVLRQLADAGAIDARAATATGALSTRVSLPTGDIVSMTADADGATPEGDDAGNLVFVKQLQVRIAALEQEREKSFVREGLMTGRLSDLEQSVSHLKSTLTAIAYNPSTQSSPEGQAGEAAGADTGTTAESGAAPVTQNTSPAKAAKTTRKGAAAATES